METSGLLSLALIVFVYGVLSRHLDRWAITAPMVFVAVGWLIGPDGFSVLNIGFEQSGVRLLAEATLVLVLYADATRIDLMVLRRQLKMPGRLLGIGLPLTIISGGLLAGWLIPGISVAEGLLIGAILAPTDAALGQAVISDKRVPVRVRQALNVESGLNDGIALPMVTALVALAAAEADLETPTFWLQFALREIGLGVLVGVAVGVAGGYIIHRAWELEWVTGPARQLATLAVAVGAFSLTEMVDGNGFIAAFVAGLAFGAAARDIADDAAYFTEDVSQLATWMTFLFFGVGLVGPAVANANVGTVIYVILSLTLVRMIPVALAMWGTHCARSTGLFIGWFGPRGLASILFALLIVDEADLIGESIILETVSLAVLASVFLHGASARRLARGYADGIADMSESMPEMLGVDEMRSARRTGID